MKSNAARLTLALPEGTCRGYAKDAEEMTRSTLEEGETQMLNSHPCKTVLSFIALVTALLVLPATASEVPNQLPDPDGEPADMTKPVQVFILMGQSNMLGFGRVAPEDKNGTLSHLVKQ
jgi:hypothetical protein